MFMSVCFRRAGENIALYWSHTLPWLQSYRRQLCLQSRKSAQSPRYRRRCPGLGWMHCCSSLNLSIHIYSPHKLLFADLMGMFDKRRFRKLLLFALNFDIRNPRTYHDIDPDKTTTRDLFCRFDLGLDVMEFTGHAIALCNNERSVTAAFGKTHHAHMTSDVSFFVLFFNLPLVTWTSHVGKPLKWSGCTVSLWPATAAARTFTPCMAWGKYHRALQGYTYLNVQYLAFKV